MQQHTPKAELAATAADFGGEAVDVQEVKKEIDAALDNPQAAVEGEAHSDGHVHGPNCGHDHAHDEAPAEPPKGRYLDPSMIPELNLRASFDLNNSGPIWRKGPQELLTNISVQAALVPEGGVKLCFVNNEAYKFLLALGNFRKKFTPASAEQQKKGIVGLYDTQVIIVCDALWDQGEQVTLHKAIYFCDEVVTPTTELTIETAQVVQFDELCDDEGCPERGTDHVHPVGAPAEESAVGHTD
jgi:hypothetical protein